MLNWVNGLLEDCRRRRAERRNRRYWYPEEWPLLSIAVGPEGVTVSSNSKRQIVNTPCSIGWAEFDRIVVYKRDRMTVDDICMAFQAAGDTVLEVSEDMKGWASLIGALSDYLDYVVDAESWFADVVRPAFEPCTTTIYIAATGSVQTS